MERNRVMELELELELVICYLLFGIQISSFFLVEIETSPKKAMRTKVVHKLSICLLL